MGFSIKIGIVEEGAAAYWIASEVSTTFPEI